MSCIVCLPAPFTYMHKYDFVRAGFMRIAFIVRFSPNIMQGTGHIFTAAN